MSVPNKDWFGTVTGDVAFDPTVTGPMARVYLVLVMYRNRDSDQCYPSNETIGKHTGMSLATVKRVLRDMVQAGIIKREDRFVDGRQTTSVTTLLDAKHSRG